jgi:hypothetical protein
MNTYELVVAFVLFSRNLLNGHQLVSVASFLMKGHSKRKLKKNQNLEMVDVTLVLPAPHLYTSLMCLFCSLPFQQCNASLNLNQLALLFLYFIC